MAARARANHADDPASRQRFLLEAEITGGLEHPGIVPVYGLGTYGDGRPYYAMRFIRGDSLKEAIERFHADEALKNDPGRRSLELRKLLRRFVDVCNAIDYAHSRGVLHRDLKPGNVIVGKYGETLVVDWGLAKAMGRAEPASDAGERTLVPSSASGSAETLPGQRAGHAGLHEPRAGRGATSTGSGRGRDVYSLGATLYCLLTGRPPFEGDDVGEVLRERAAGRVPAAAAGRPGDRPGAGGGLPQGDGAAAGGPLRLGRALAEDVERWLADEPVTAWREPLARRARRWARRNRTAVTAAAAALVAGVVGLAAVLAVQTRAKADLARALAARRRPTRRWPRQRRAEPLEGGRAGAVRPGGRGDQDVPHRRQRGLPAQGGEVQGPARPAAEVGRRLLRQARRPAGQGDGPGVAAGAGAGELRAGRADGQGRPHGGRAGGAPGRCWRRREALAAEPGADAEATADVGRSLTAVAGLLEATGKTDEAMAAYRKAEALLAGPARSSPTPAARAALAACRSRLGWLLSRHRQVRRGAGGVPPGAGRPGGAGRRPRGVERGPARPGGHDQPHRPSC